MTYAGTVTVTKIAKNVLKIHAADFDADAEFTQIDLSTYRMEGAQDFTMQAQRTAGAQDVISLNVQASNDGVNFVGILTIPAANSWVAAVNKSCSHIRITCTTVGGGNILDAWVYCVIN